MTDPPPEPPEPTTPKSAKALPTYAVVVAVVLLVAYLVLVLIQWFAVDSSDLHWSRRSELLTGIEALAFAAAGAILGTTVQRQVTAKAEKDADEAKAEAGAQKGRADANEKEAAKGRALLNLVATRAKQEAPADAPPVRRGAGPSAPNPTTPYQELLDFAASFDEDRRPGP